MFFDERNKEGLCDELGCLRKACHLIDASKFCTKHYIEYLENEGMLVA